MSLRFWCLLPSIARAINNRHKTCQHLLYCSETVLVCHLCKTVNSLQQGDEISNDDDDGDGDDIYTPLSVYHNHHGSATGWKLLLSPLYRHGN